MRFIAIVVIGTFLLSTPRPASAWNDTGHMTVALIAYRQLNDQQRQRVSEILRKHPHYELYLSARRPEGVREDEWAFLRGAVWSDFVRPARPGRAASAPAAEVELFKGPEITRYDRSPWHYITIPWVPPSERKNFNPTTLPSRPTPNAAEALEENSKILADGSAKPEDRAVALTWMEHVTGDIHQPLHACSMWSSQYPNGDRGGNDEAVRPNGAEAMRLHSFWDGALGSSDAYTAIAFLADQITGDPQLAPEKLAELKKDTTFSSWADESHEYAIALVYLNGRLRTVPYAGLDARQAMPDQVPSLPPSYAINAHALAKRRIAAAGYRLAEQIKQLLGG
jgi:hypothetical protein